MLTNGAKRSRRCGGTDTRVTRTPPCSDSPQPCPRCQDMRPSAAHGYPGRFQTTSQPSQGECRQWNLAAFLFKRKEEKKYPTTQRTKPIMNRNSGSLCLLSVLYGGLPELSSLPAPSAVHVYLIPTRTSGPVSPAPPCTPVTCWSCCGLGDRVYLWALSAP